MIKGKYHVADEEDCREPKGLSDGGETVISCSVCRAPLLQTLITRPNQDVVWSIAKIICPWCGDHSFMKEIRGGIHIAGTDYCKVVDLEYNGQQIKPIVCKGDKTYVR